MRNIPLWLLPLSIGCWSESVQPDQVVWSDDGTEKLVIELLFEEKGAIGDTSNKRNFRHQLLRADGTEPVGDVREGQNGAELYFMKSRGYIVSTYLDDSAIVRTLHTSLRDLRTVPVPEFSPTDPGYFVPSPSGEHIARVASGGANIDILDGNFLTVLGQVSLPVTGGADWTWRPDGLFVIATEGEAWAIDPDGGVTNTDIPACFYPKTTSSPISADGEFIYMDAAGIQTGATDPSTAFGCQ